MLGRQLAPNIGHVGGGKVVHHLRQHLGVLLVHYKVAMIAARAPVKVDGHLHWEVRGQ